jgi:DNA-directed RNA polymerase sigma subunit (sigma70/sigma32)
MKSEFFACLSRKVMTEKDLEIYRTEISDMEVRNLLIVQDRSQGATYREIGQKFQLSHERVRALVARHERTLRKESKKLMPMKNFLEMLSYG